MRKTKIAGWSLCLVAVALGGLFLWGLVVRNYLAVAIPAAAVTFVGLAFIFWMGRTLVLAEDETAAVEVAGPPQAGRES